MTSSYVGGRLNRRYVRTDGQAGTVEAVPLDGSGAVLEFLRLDADAFNVEAGVLSIISRHGVVIPVRTGEYVVRDEAGHISHLPADAFAETFKPADADESDEVTAEVNSLPGPDTITPGEVAVGIVDESGESAGI